MNKINKKEDNKLEESLPKLPKKPKFGVGDLVRLTIHRPEFGSEPSTMTYVMVVDKVVVYKENPYQYRYSLISEDKKITYAWASNHQLEKVSK